MYNKKATISSYFVHVTCKSSFLWDSHFLEITKTIRETQQMKNRDVKYTRKFSCTNKVYYRFVADNC